MTEFKSPSWEGIIRHEAVHPFSPAGKKDLYCQLCKRLVADTNFHGEPLFYSEGWAESLQLFFRADLSLQTAMQQMASVGRQVNPESVRAQRHQMVLEGMLQRLFTAEERLSMEIDIDNQMAEEIQNMLRLLQQEAAAARLAVPQQPGRIIIPGRG